MEGKDGETLPVVIVSERGEILDVTKMNRKGYTKSTERGELWTLNEETGRLLPYQEGTRIARLEDWGRWYQAVIREGSASARPPAAGAPVDSSPPANLRQSAQPATASSDVIDRLERLIASRKQERPPGSYTSYLFDSGPEKIRKKTGEEAVELLLARDRNEIVSESADFIYHLLVLFCELEIPFSEVASELERREAGR